MLSDICCCCPFSCTVSASSIPDDVILSTFHTPCCELYSTNVSQQSRICRFQIIQNFLVITVSCADFNLWHYYILMTSPAKSCQAISCCHIYMCSIGSYCILMICYTNMYFICSFILLFCIIFFYITLICCTPYWHSY